MKSSRPIAAEILTTGDELLRGDVVNTNATWLATRLKQLGVELNRVVTVGDALEGLTDAVLEALPRCELLVVSGGLGPTDDDRTTLAVARAVGAEPLELHAAALEAMRERFARGGYQLTPNNDKQAYLPRGATLLPNAYGTAPGFLLRAEGAPRRCPDGGLEPCAAATNNHCRVICLPGVPSELKGIFEDEVVPRLRAELALSPALHLSLNVFGLGESQIDHRLGDLLQSCGGAGSCTVTVHYRTCFPENRVLLVVRPGEGGHAEAAALLGRLEAQARARLGRHVFGVDEQSFADAVVAALREAAATVALAESCTGGQAGNLITSAAGSSDVFGLGVVSYSNQFKQRVLGVPEDVLARHGAVSRECVLAMANGVRALAGSTYGVAVSGIAGPGGATADKPVGTVHFALCGPQGVRHLHRVFPFDRLRVKRIAAYTALSLVLHEAKGLLPSTDDPLEGRWAPREQGQEKS